MVIKAENKESFWRVYANDFEKKQRYVTGENAFNSVIDELQKERELGDLLDIGCGTCSYTIKLVDNAKSITATDYSDDMVIVAAERTKMYPSVTCKKADARDLPFKDNQFDTVLIANLIHIVDDPQRVLFECYRVLKPGGRVIITSFTLYKMKVLERLRMAKRFLKTFGIPPKAKNRSMTPEQLSQLMLDCGFIVARSHLVGQEVNCNYAVGVKA